MSRPCIGSSSFMTVYAFCPRAKSAPVERRFSHCGLFVRSHQARIGRTFQFQLTLAKCNRCSLLHCLTVICLDTRVLANVPVSGKNVLPPTLLVGYFGSAIDARTVPKQKKNNFARLVYYCLKHRIAHLFTIQINVVYARRSWKTGAVVAAVIQRVA